MIRGRSCYEWLSDVVAAIIYDVEVADARGAVDQQTHTQLIPLDEDKAGTVVGSAGTQAHEGPEIDNRLDRALHVEQAEHPGRHAGDRARRSVALQPGQQGGATILQQAVEVAADG